VLQVLGDHINLEPVILRAVQFKTPPKLQPISAIFAEGQMHCPLPGPPRGSQIQCLAPLSGNVAATSPAPREGQSARAANRSRCHELGECVEFDNAPYIVTSTSRLRICFDTFSWHERYLGRPTMHWNISYGSSGQQSTNFLYWELSHALLPEPCISCMLWSAIFVCFCVYAMMQCFFPSNRCLALKVF
jgi:hypothetical protein